MVTKTETMMKSTHKYYNRDISWLSFNYRVLEEAADTNVPLYERIKFLAIYSSNLDEFYRVRVASIRSILSLSNTNRKKLKFDPDKLLLKINTIVSEQSEEFSRIFDKQILPELRSHNITLHQQDLDLSREHTRFIQDFFQEEIISYMQPVLLVKGKIMTFLRDNTIYLAIRMYRKIEKGQSAPARRRARYGLVRIPTHRIARFIQLPKIDDEYHIIFLDDIIRHHLGILYPGYDIDSSYSIKLSRDADLQIEDEFSGNLVEKVKKSLSKRKTGEPSRFLYDKNMPLSFLKLLMEVFNLSREDLVPGSRYHNIDDFFGFPNPLSPQLEREKFAKLPSPELDRHPSLFQAIKEKDRMLHFPYHAYDYVIRLLNEAAIDPKVEEIKVTQYRVARDSLVVNTLINAANNGKKVTVFVEVKARFDEANNLYSAEQMKQAGIRIITSLPGLKVHAKLALVLMKPSKEGIQKGFVYSATGNFNEKTAKLYADEGFFTANQGIVEDAIRLFDFLSNQDKKPVLNHLLVGQINLTDKLIEMIDREIKNSQEGQRGYMLLKMNSLEDPKMIEKLYDASKAGVQIDLIVRGIICLLPEQSYSENIRVSRIVDKYLEHARVFVFYNNGQNDMYISSADWMKRNLRRRIETAVPIYDEDIKQEMLDILQIQLNDNTKARWIDSRIQNVPKYRGEDDKKIRAQYEIYNYLKEKQQKI